MPSRLRQDLSTGSLGAAHGTGDMGSAKKTLSERSAPGPWAGGSSSNEYLH